MTRATPVERILLVLVLIPLAVTGFAGIRDGLRAVSHAVGAVQAVSVSAKLAFGLCGLAGAGATVARRRWALHVLIAWAISLAIATVVEPTAWSGAAWKDAVGTGTVVKVVLSGIIAWGGAAHARRPAPAPASARSAD
jgi:hypothetical protein